MRWLIPRLAGFHQLHQHIDVQLTTSSAALNFDREGIDAGIQLGGGSWSGCGALRLIPNELVPVAAPSLHIDPTLALRGESVLHSLARPED